MLTAANGGSKSNNSRFRIHDRSYLRRISVILTSVQDLDSWFSGFYEELTSYQFLQPRDYDFSVLASTVFSEDCN